MYCFFVCLFVFLREKPDADELTNNWIRRIFSPPKKSYLYTLGGVVNSVNKEIKVWSLTMENYSLLVSSPKIIKPSAPKVVRLTKDRRRLQESL